MSDTSPPNTPRTGKWLRIALVASLALNLLVIGIFVGANFRDEPRSKPRGPAFAGDLRSLAAAMPERPREALRGVLSEQPKRHSDRRKMITEGRMRFVDALESEPFEIDAVEAVFEEQQDTFRATARDGYMLILDAIEGMSEDERRAFAANLREALSRPRKR